MNENIDLTEILKGCPKGTAFYSNVYGKVYFNGFNFYSDYPVVFNYLGDGSVCLTKAGKVFIHIGECIVFPSEEQRDWSKFERFWDKPKVDKFDPKTFKTFDEVLIRPYLGCTWEPDFFGYKTDNWVKCITTGVTNCIPYNEETKHLVGTNNDCPEYYKWWEK